MQKSFLGSVNKSFVSLSQHNLLIPLPRCSTIKLSSSINSSEKTTGRAKLKFEHNAGAYNGLMISKFGGARSRDQIFTGQKLAKNG